MDEMDDIVKRIRRQPYFGLEPYEAADEIEQLRQRVQELEQEVAQWKNHHETEVRRARILKERTDMPIERVQAYEKWGEDQARIGKLTAERDELRRFIERISQYCSDKDWQLMHLEISEAAASVKEK